MPLPPDYKLVDSNSGKHLYKRGWFGLIPGWGALLGIWLLLVGVVRYKDKKLVFIGLACILFTILVFGTLIYYTFYSDAGRRNFTPGAKMIMNSLIKDIEFYKLQNGEYPDSLEQMKQKSNLSIIYDPISVRSSTKFYYKNLDSGYYLFSCGLDMLPFTQDDVFPDIELSMTGLRKIPK